MIRRKLAVARIVAPVALLLVGVLAGAQSGAPPEYGYGNIPFGSTAQQVLAELGGATVETDGVRRRTSSVTTKCCGTSSPRGWSPT